ncbi:MAG TPA: hypothetical protein VF841_10985 [Anaeromyxobacter sp.]
MKVENQRGVFLVRYDDPAELAPARQGELLAALREGAREGPIAVVFVVAPAVQAVGHEIPGHWLQVTSDSAMRLAAVAVVTPNAAVSVATRAFGTFNILRSTNTAVSPFASEREALEWAAGKVAAAGGRPEPR